jgi:cell division protein FtsB
MQRNKQTLKTSINLVPKKLLIYQKLKIVQWIVLGICLLALVLMGVFAAKGYMQIDDLNKELAQDQQIIAEGHLDELNALKEQYDNLILGIDSGNITLIPDIEIKMTELFGLITKHKPSAVHLVGVDGQLKSTGEYTYRMEYSSADRTVISAFLEKLQEEKLEYINISTISKSVEDEKIEWLFSITVKIGGISE